MENNKGLPAGKKLSPRQLIIIIMAAAIVILIGVIIKLSSDLSRIKKQLSDDEDYIIAQASRVFEYYGEKDVINLDDPTYGDTWLEAVKDVPRNEIDFSQVKLEKGYKHYYVDGQKVSKAGIDVSYHNGDIDWAAVKADGVDFAMLRVGYRGYESGQITLDERFHEYAKGALDAGVDIGAYFYSQAVTEEEAAEEAEFVMEQLAGYDVKYPVCFDWEIVGEKSARTNTVSADMLNRCAAAFCNTLAENRYIPMIYSVKRMALVKLDMSRLSGFDFWLAEYREKPEYPYRFTIWQYASDGKVNGINGNVDLNLSIEDYSAIRR